MAIPAIMLPIAVAFLYVVWAVSLHLRSTSKTERVGDVIYGAGTPEKKLFTAESAHGKEAMAKTNNNPVQTRQVQDEEKQHISNLDVSQETKTPKSIWKTCSAYAEKSFYFLFQALVIPRTTHFPAQPFYQTPFSHICAVHTCATLIEGLIWNQRSWRNGLILAAAWGTFYFQEQLKEPQMKPVLSALILVTTLLVVPMVSAIWSHDNSLIYSWSSIILTVDVSYPYLLQVWPSLSDSKLGAATFIVVVICGVLGTWAAIDRIFDHNQENISLPRWLTASVHAVRSSLPDAVRQILAFLAFLAFLGFCAANLGYLNACIVDSQRPYFQTDFTVLIFLVMLCVGLVAARNLDERDKTLMKLGLIMVEAVLRTVIVLLTLAAFSWFMDHRPSELYRN